MTHPTDSQPPQPPQPSPPQSGSGLAPNVAGALAYVLGPITGIIFLVIEKENRFVRFHAAQSIVVWVALVAVYFALSIVGTILSLIPIVGWIAGLLLFFVSLALGFGAFVLWIMLMIKAYGGDEWRLPKVADFADKLVATPALQ